RTSSPPIASTPTVADAVELFVPSTLSSTYVLVPAIRTAEAGRRYTNSTVSPISHLLPDDVDHSPRRRVRVQPLSDPTVMSRGCSPSTAPDFSRRVLSPCCRQAAP